MCVLISEDLTHLILHVLSVQIGEERATAIALMRKFIAYQFTDTVRNIISCIISWDHITQHGHFSKPSFDGISLVRTCLIGQ